MKPTYWIISRELLKRCLEHSKVFACKQLEIVSSDYDENRQHVRALVQSMNAPLKMPEHRVKTAIEGGFCKDVAVMNVSYLGYGQYSVNLDVKVGLDTSIGITMRQTDLSWLGEG